MLNEERIQQEMFETRASLADKLETLEQKVAGTVNQVKAVVDDTIGVIKETVQDTKETVNVVTESVQEGVKSVQKNLDVTVHVAAHPWWAMAGSVATGFCLGAMLNRPHHAGYHQGISNGSRGSDFQQPSQPTLAKMPAKSESSMWSAEIDKLKGLAVGAIFGTARELIASSLPEQIVPQVKEFVDNVTRKAGGEPLPSSVWADLMKYQSKRQPASRQDEFRKVVPVEGGGEA